MQISDVPDYFLVPWAAEAGAGYITNPLPLNPASSGHASIKEGFPPINFVQLDSGGIPPWGADANGALFQVSSWNRWASAGAPNYWSAALSAAIGGYPAGAIVSQAANLGNWWLCLVDNNTSDPDTGGANWIGFGIYGVARVVTASGFFTLNANDDNVGLLRTSALNTSSTILPSVINAKKIHIQDLAGNFSTYPCNVSASPGTTIAGLANVNLTFDRQWAEFTYYASNNIWGVRF